MLDFLSFVLNVEIFLYKTPAKEMTGIYRRVALSTVESHNEFLEHNAEIVTREISTNETRKWINKNEIIFI